MPTPLDKVAVHTSATPYIKAHCSLFDPISLAIMIAVCAFGFGALVASGSDRPTREAGKYDTYQKCDPIKAQSSDLPPRMNHCIGILIIDCFAVCVFACALLR